jgi:LAO/AO transport system kinase
LRTVATEGAGVPELASAIQKHRQFLVKNGGWEQRERARLQSELDARIRENLLERWRSGLSPTAYQETLEALLAREISPQEAVNRLVNKEERRE